MTDGIDVGSVDTKRANGIIIPSKVSTFENILKNKDVLKTNAGTFYIGEGHYDTSYRKAKRQYYKELFLYALGVDANKTEFFKVVVGLPISQYKQDKEPLKDLLLRDRVNKVEINGVEKTLVIDDIEVYPEGIAAVEDDFEGVVVDIGGRTTDVCLVVQGSKGKKIENPLSLPAGTLNLYSDFIKAINTKYCLDLRLEDADKILKKGLRVDGEEVDCSFAVDCFKSYVTDLVNKIQVEYSIRTLDLRLTGGGSLLLYKAIKKRLPTAELIDNSVFANALGFKKVGEQIWQ